MFCFYCSNAINDGDAYCENCGKKIEASIHVNCTYCGKIVEKTDNFCEHCGEGIGGAGITSNQPVQPIVKSTIPPPMTQITTSRVSQHPSTPSPRMPIIFLIDTSASGAPYINQLFINFNKFIMDLNTEIIIKNTLDMAIIEFNENYNMLHHLSEITNLKISPFTSNGNAYFSTPIREALKMAEDYKHHHVNSYKPWVVLITSSEPSDDISEIAIKLQQVQADDKLRFMVLGVMDCKSEALKKLTDVVFRQKGIDFTSFFEWISKCIKAIIRTIPGDKPQLPSLEGNVYRDK